MLRGYMFKRVYPFFQWAFINEVLQSGFSQDHSQRHRKSMVVSADAVSPRHRNAGSNLVLDPFIEILKKIPAIMLFFI